MIKWYLLALVIGFLITRGIIQLVFNIKYKKEKIMYSGVVDYMNKVYDNSFAGIAINSEDEDIISMKNELLSYMDKDTSKSQFIRNMKLMYFSPILNSTMKIKWRDFVDKFDYLYKAIAKYKISDFECDLEKFYICSGLYINYYLRIMYNPESPDNFIPSLYYSYLKSLKFTPYLNMDITDSMNMDHFNSTFKVSDKKTNKFLSLIDNYHAKSMFDYCNGMIYSTGIFKYSDTSKYEHLTDLKEKCKEDNIEMYKDISKGFDDIINDDRFIPLSYIEDVEVVDYRLKILMYYDVDRKKVLYKEYVKENDSNAYHTIRKDGKNRCVKLVEYLMYLISGFYIFLAEEEV